MVRKRSKEVASRRDGRIGCVCKKRRPCGRCGEHVMKKNMSRERQAENNWRTSIRTPFWSEDAVLQEGNSSSTSASYGCTSQNGTMSFTCISRSSSFSSRHTQIHPSLETPEGLSGSAQYRLTKSMLSRNLTLLSSPEKGNCPKPTDLEDDAHAPLSPSFCVFVSPEDTTGAEEGEAQRPLFCQEASAFTTFAATESGRASENDILQYFHNNAERVSSSGTKRMDQDEESPVGEDKKIPSVFHESAHGEAPDCRHILRQNSSVSDARDESPGSSRVLKGVESVSGSVEADTRCDSENSSSCKNARIEGVTPPREVVRERRRRTKRRRVSLTTVSRLPPLLLDTSSLREKSGLKEKQSVCTNHRRYRSAPESICSAEEFICSNLLSEPSPPNGENVTLEMGEAETAVELSSQPETLRSASRSLSHSPGGEKDEHQWSETERFLSVVGEGIVNILGRGADTLQNILSEKALQHWAGDAASVTSETSLEEGRAQGESCTEKRRRKRPLPDFPCSLPFSCNKGATCSFSSFSASVRQVCTQEGIWRECSRRLQHRRDGTDTSPVCSTIERNEGQTDAIVDHLRQPIQHRECTALQVAPITDQENSSPSVSSYLAPKKKLAMLQRPSSSFFVFPYSSPEKLPTCFSPLQAVSPSFGFMPCDLPRTGHPDAIRFCSFPSYSPRPTCGKSSDRSACHPSVALPRQSPRENFQQRGELLRSAFRHVRRISSLPKRRTTAANGQGLKPDPVKRGGSSEFSSRSWPADTTKSRFSGPHLDTGLNHIQQGPWCSPLLCALPSPNVAVRGKTDETKMQETQASMGISLLSTNSLLECRPLEQRVYHRRVDNCKWI
uniref:Uncharacterized protein n=1 Tax=Toxoplasma gondii COUG TaxID=1074873 RepID=A0A2G8XRL8_TOXGO|nr:hypothetical protein TGCOUG_293252 [Toxoplasma gondii COUG]